MSKNKRCLITGGCGFLGSHLIEHILKNTDWQVVVLDKLTYASNGFDRLKDIKAFDDKRVLILTADFAEPIKNGLAKEIGELDYILHLGAETHVDRSIENPEPFVVSNVVGTMRMLDFARTQKNLKWFVMFSTDEVYGPAPEGTDYREYDRMNPTNPYSATKAGAEALAMSYANTYKLPVMITNTMNCIGERQHPEKFVPMTIRKILNGETVIIHSDPTKTKAGKRHYIHGRNVAAAVLFLLGKVQFEYPPYDIQTINGMEMPVYRYRYNIVGEKEVDNLELAQTIAGILGKELKYEMTDFHSQRPGHDLRYSLCGDKLASLGWSLPKTFEESLKKTIEWSVGPDNKKWLNLN